MKINVVFTIAAIVMVIIGLAQMLAPAALFSAAGIEGTPSTGYLMTIRFLGVEMLGLGLIAWFVRNAESSKTRNAVALGFAIYFILHALTSLYGQFTDTTTSVHWVAATIQGLFAIAFFTAKRP